MQPLARFLVRSAVVRIVIPFSGTDMPDQPIVAEEPIRKTCVGAPAEASPEEAFVRTTHPAAWLYEPTAPRGSQRAWSIRKTSNIADSYLAKNAASPEEAWSVAVANIKAGKDE